MSWRRPRSSPEILKANWSLAWLRMGRFCCCQRPAGRPRGGRRSEQAAEVAAESDDRELVAFQADVFACLSPPKASTFIYSIGCAPHTPDCEAAVKARIYSETRRSSRCSGSTADTNTWYASGFWPSTDTQQEFEAGSPRPCTAV